MTQPMLDLFEEPAAPPASLVPVCHLCGEAGPPVEIEGGPGAPWREAEAWAYVSLQAHMRYAHPNSVTP